VRRAAVLKVPYRARTKVSRSTSIPAPVGGWNARDPIASMDEKDAILLDNFFPTASDVMLRKGETNHVTGIGAQVNTIMPYTNPGGTTKLFCAAGANIYDVTTADTAAVSVVSSTAESKWDWTIFTTSAATYGVAANGTDTLRYYDGSSWTAITAISSPAIAGVTTSTLQAPEVHKNRLWFVENGTLSAWYLPTDAVGGTAAEFPFAGIASKGGHLVQIGTWTIDAGAGVDDHFVAVTSEGQVIVYKGTDPSSANTWALVGVWNIGRPLGRRPLIKWAGDLLIITREGVFPLSKALISASVDPKVAITDKIRQAMSDAATLYGDNFGWQMLHYPGADMLILNVPVATGSGQHQYVMNTITGNWGRFKEIEANCWALYGGEPYFGGNGVVQKFWAQFSDNGTNIDGDIKQAFNYFGARGVLKSFKDLRPIFATDGSPAIRATLNVDYNDDEPSGTLSFAPTSYAAWDAGVWDVGIWGGGLSPFAEWQGAGGTGTCAALRMKVAANGIEVRHQATDYLYETGGVIG